MPGGDNTDTNGEQRASDKRHEWLYNRVQTVFKHVKQDKFDKAWKEPETVDRIEDFLNNPESRLLLVYSDNITVASEFPKKIPQGQSCVLLEVQPSHSAQ
eukprot:gb/GECG01014945.1/.p1 GENE.gb/GECG01014945.1/~~gb/GECG01014945.1/.p1  ORF type:complete len:100 (+),score=12.14 gb/GECG01014945.1/:1-300(+)